MAMLTSSGEVVPFHGDHHPVSVAEGRKSRNLYIPFTISSQEKNGLTYWADADTQTFSLSGTASKDMLPFNTTAQIELEPGTYTVSLEVVSGTANNAIGVQGYWNNSFLFQCRVGNVVTFTVSERVSFAKRFIAYANRETNCVLRVMLNEGSAPLPYEPYGTVTDTIFKPTNLKKSGTELTFEKSYNHSAEVEVAGKSEQVQLTGKNLFDYDSMVPGFSSGGANEQIHSESGTDVKTSQRIYVKPSTTYTLNMKTGLDVADQASNKYLWFSVKQFEQDGTFVLEGVRSHETTSVEKTYTFATQARTGFLRISFRTYDTLGRAWAQLEEGSTATPYEPYVGGIPSPNPDYPQPITSIDSVELVSGGRNLFDYNKVVTPDGTWEDGVFVSTKADSEARTIFQFQLWNDGKYVRDAGNYSAKVGRNVFTLIVPSLVFDRTRFKINGRSADISLWHTGTKFDFPFKPGETYTMTMDIDRLESNVIGGVVVRNLQIEKGSTPHPYEPYHSTTRTIDLQGNQLRSMPDGTHDTLVLKRTGECWIEQKCWYVKKRVADMDNQSPDFPGWRTSDVNAFFAPGTNTNKHSINSIGVPYQSGQTNTIGINNRSNPGVMFFYRPLGMNQFAFMAAYPDLEIEFVVKADIPQAIPLPPIDPLPTYWPTTVIYDEHGNDISAYVKVVDDAPTAAMVSVLSKM